MSAKQKAWQQAFTKGSKALQARLSAIHKDNPDFQEFIKNQGHGEILSKKQSELQKKPTAAPPVTAKADHSLNRSTDREAIIRNAAQKVHARNAAKSNRSTWGGELGGGFSMPNSSFRRYSEALDVSTRLKKKVTESFDEKSKIIGAKI